MRPVTTRPITNHEDTILTEWFSYVEAKDYLCTMPNIGQWWSVKYNRPFTGYRLTNT